MSERSTFDVTWKAIGKILVAAALVWVWLQLWQFVMVIIIAIVMAVAIDPIVKKLEARGVPRGLGAFGLVLLLAAIAVGMIAASWVSITQQSKFILQNITGFSEQIRATFPAIDQIMPAAQGGSGNGLSQYAMGFGRSFATAAGMFVVALVLTVYLLIEWKTTLEWAIAFVPAQHRQKVRRTLSEARETVYRYVVGNAITSLITAVATFIVLIVLKVPAALVLAIIAGLLDFIPIVGFLLSLGVTALLAATVSMTALIGVVAFYFLFNAIENYFIMPKVYGHELALSNLAVLIAVAVGGQLGGVMGALLALPIAATYPTVERIWLKQRLTEDAVEVHKRLSA
jgi:predicted PurR-regulated permease PerM